MRAFACVLSGFLCWLPLAHVHMCIWEKTMLWLGLHLWFVNVILQCGVKVEQEHCDWAVSNCRFDRLQQRNIVGLGQSVPEFDITSRLLMTISGCWKSRDKRPSAPTRHSIDRAQSRGIRRRNTPHTSWSQFPARSSSTQALHCVSGSATRDRTAQVLAPTELKILPKIF